MIEVIGWTVDMEPCVTDGGVGVGFNFYVLFPNGTISRFWWCSSRESIDQWIDSGDVGKG